MMRIQGVMGMFHTENDIEVDGERGTSATLDLHRPCITMFHRAVFAFVNMPMLK